jgi:hypothetical protein
MNYYNLLCSQNDDNKTGDVFTMYAVVNYFHFKSFVNILKYPIAPMCFQKISHFVVVVALWLHNSTSALEVEFSCL